MPGGQATVAQPAQPAQQDAPLEPFSLLRPVQNKIRNLRKKIETATALEEALARGDSLQSDQLESVRSKPVKAALLADLEEILKKQTTIAEDLASQAGIEKPVKDSKRAAKRREKAAAAAAAAEANAAAAAAATAAETNDASGETASGSIAGAGSEPEKLLDGPLDSGHIAKAAGNGGAHPNGSDSTFSLSTVTAVKRVLELLHVVDYLKETPDGKASILAYFAAQDSSTQRRIVSAYDVDLLFYFSTMLTSPDGNVAHALAVETSTAHCLAYLQKPEAEAFAGTTYVTLAEIVEAIGESPLLARRGEPIPVQEAQIAFGTGGFVAADSAIAAVGPVGVSQSGADTVTPPVNATSVAPAAPVVCMSAAAPMAAALPATSSVPAAPVAASEPSAAGTHAGAPAAVVASPAPAPAPTGDTNPVAPDAPVAVAGTPGDVAGARDGASNVLGTGSALTAGVPGVGSSGERLGSGVAGHDAGGVTGAGMRSGGGGYTGRGGGADGQRWAPRRGGRRGGRGGTAGPGRGRRGAAQAAAQ